MGLKKWTGDSSVRGRSRPRFKGTANRRENAAAQNPQSTVHSPLLWFCVLQYWRAYINSRTVFQPQKQREVHNGKAHNTLEIEGGFGG